MVCSVNSFSDDADTTKIHKRPFAPLRKCDYVIMYYSTRLQWILDLQAPGQELSEKLGLTSEARKASKLSAKSMIDENSTSSLLPWLLYQDQDPLQACVITSLRKCILLI